MEHHGRLRFDREALQQICRERGWSAYRLANEIGVDRAYTYRVLSGEQNPGQKFLLGLHSVGIELKQITKVEAVGVAPDPDSAVV